MNIIPTLNEKCKGAMISFAIGDALGWPNERRTTNVAYNKNYLSQFKEWKKKAGGRYWSHNENILAGEYSDDTQIMLAIARSLLSGFKWDEYFVKYELPFWRSYERGGGSAVLRAASQWEHNIEPWRDKGKEQYYFAGGNGVAMRIIPHVIINQTKNNFDIIAEEIVKDAILTHGHPRAILGALCYAYALYYCFKKTTTLQYGELVVELIENNEIWSGFPKYIKQEWLIAANDFYEYKQVWNDVSNHIIESLKKIKTSVDLGVLDVEIETLMALGCFDKNINGAGDIAAVASIYFASKYANNPTLGIKQAANAFGADTDTIAAMTGGLLGSLNGLDWIPYEWQIVQDYNCIELMAEYLVSENGSKILKDYIANKKQEDTWIRLPIGKAKYVKEENIPCGKTGQVLITKYLTVLGQSIYLKEYHKEKNKKQVNRNEILKINRTKLKQIILDDASCDISLLLLIKILELKQEGNSIIEIANGLQLNVELINKLLNIVS